MNIQVTRGTTLNDARSESCIVINPNNPMQVVAASKKFNDITTYDFTLATAYSTDGGVHWHESAPLMLNGFTQLTDPTMAWDDVGNVYLLGLAGENPPQWDQLGMVVYKSTDGGKTWSAPMAIHSSSDDDKQWMAGDGNPASPFHGRVYGVWDGPGGIFFARTLDHGASWVGAGTGAAPPIAAITSVGIYPEINVAQDGTIYIAAISGSTLKLMVSTDGGDNFTAAADPATGIISLSSSLSYLGDFPVFPGGIFRVLTLPTACVSGSRVVVAWSDMREGVARIYYALSNDGGASWDTGDSGQPLLSAPVASNLQHFHPQVMIDANGAIGCAFYEFGPKPSTYKIDVKMAQSYDGGASFQHFTVTDQPWDPTVDAPLSHGTLGGGQTFIGDYFGLDANAGGFMPLWTDTRTGIQELFTEAVPEKRLQIIVERSTIGQDEVDARRLQTGGASAVLDDAFRVVIDGCTAAELGITGAGNKLPVVSPIDGMSVSCNGNYSATGGYGSEVQRFTFTYDVDFGSDETDPAFNFAEETKTITLHAADAGVSGVGQIMLIKQPDPYMLHGDPTWLSVDLRTFSVRPGDTLFGVTMGPDASDAPDFIQHVAKALSNGNGSAGGQSFNDHAVLPADVQASSLYLYERDENNVRVFNFALARVRYVGLIGAANVRVFFRLFNAQSTSTSYDYPPGHRYRKALSNPQGQPIPLPGIQGSDYATMPFFALPRVDSTTVGMDSQTDSHTVGGQVLGNIQTITAHAGGTEVDTFFGCWLDINQAGPVLPAQVDSLHPDGPFQSSSNPPDAIQQAVLRNLHQCLIAEVAFDPVTTPVGKDPSNWDKLAQRNLAWSDVGSASAVTTFEIRPTRPGLGRRLVDELMIDWGHTPPGARAMIYLPEVSADEVLDLAGRLYSCHALERVDDHTIACPTGGIGYMPIPAGSEVDYTGLLTIEPPSPDWHGRAYSVVVRQVSNAYGTVPKGRAPNRADPDRATAEATTAKPKVTTKKEKAFLEARLAMFGKTDDGGGAAGGAENEEKVDALAWRRVIGAFQLNVPVKPKATLLQLEERSLGLMRWVAEAIPPGTRWYPVFQRYLDVLAGRVKDFGGDPGKILPTPPGGLHPHHPPEDEVGDHYGPCGPDHDGDLTEPGAGGYHRGKVGGLLFDHFGDFAGFILDTGFRRLHYRSRARDLEELVERAWKERLRLGVWSSAVVPDDVVSIVILTPPVGFAHDIGND